MDNEQVFTYTATAQRSGYKTTIFTLIISLLIEAALEILVISVIVPDGALKWIINLVHSGLCLWIIFFLLNSLHVLKTYHTLTPTHLKVRYGRGFKAAIPLNALSGCWFATQKIMNVQNIRASYKKDKHRLVAAFSGEGQVLLKFHQPQIFRLGLFKTVTANEILLNFDNRDEFLAALNARLLPQEAIAS